MMKHAKNFKKMFISAFSTPTNQQLVEQECRDITSFLIEKYTIEEQSYIVNQIRDKLRNHRIAEMTKSQEYYNRLNKDLTNL